MKAIIFGSGGQDAWYLATLLEQLNVEVIGIDRSAGQVNIANLSEVQKLIQSQKPDHIFHFAANSTTRHDAWQENHETIVTGTLNILESVSGFSPATKVFIPGSGLQFENQGNPIKETDPFVPTSMYAVSRIQSAYCARYYRAQGLAVYIGYLFNHDSPRRSERHVNKKIIETAKRIKNGSKEKLHIGKLSVEKEFGFAGDIVKGIWTLVNQDKISEATIGTGRSHSIEEWVKTCFDLFDLNWEDHVIDTPGFVPEYDRLVSDPSTIFSLGWKPETSLSQLAEMMK